MELNKVPVPTDYEIDPGLKRQRHQVVIVSVPAHPLYELLGRVDHKISERGEP